MSKEFGQCGTKADVKVHILREPKLGFLVFKPFKSKNRDKIDLDATNPNLKKGSDRDFWATA